MWGRGGEVDSRHREQHVQRHRAPTQHIQGTPSGSAWLEQGGEWSGGGEAEETDRRSVLEDLAGHLRYSRHAPWASSLGVT